MKANQKLHDLGQSLWLDHMTRDLLSSGTLKRYIAEFSVTGLTSNASVFDHAIRNSSIYDDAIRIKLKEGKSGEELYLELSLEDLGHAADLLRPIYDQTEGVDGWVSLEVSPLVTHDTDRILTAAVDLYARGRRPNVFIKIPGTKEGLPAVEDAIFAGVPVNVTLLFSCEQYLAAAGEFLRGIERRIAAGLKPNVRSVASMRVRGWDAAVTGKAPDALRNKLGIAMGQRTYKAHCDLLNSPRWQSVLNAGTRPQRLLWSDAEISDAVSFEGIFVKNLAASTTANTTSESILKALVDRGDIGELMPTDGGNCEEVLDRFTQAGIDIDAMAVELQNEELASSVKSWIELLMGIASKSATLMQNPF